MENPTLDFLIYLIRKCISQCDVDPAVYRNQAFFVCKLPLRPASGVTAVPSGSVKAAVTTMDPARSGLLAVAIVVGMAKPLSIYR